MKGGNEKEKRRGRGHKEGEEGVRERKEGGRVEGSI